MSQVIPLGPAARMLTTREAATRLGVSLRTVQLWVEADILPAARTPGGHRRIPYNAVEALALSTGLGGDHPGKGALTKRELMAASKAESTGAKDAEPRGRALDILLVADDQPWQDQCAAALTMFGPAVQLRTAETGYLALLQIGQKAPDVLITNLELPGLDGIAMLRTLERCESISNLRVLALTDLTDSELMRKGGLPGCAEVVRLPVSAEAIANRIGRFLVGQRASQ
ncbi:MAG: excisionase family DNA-binding protein [Acidobacteriota bacterium]